jgi:transposase
MAKALGNDLRKRIIRDHAAGASIREVAERYNVSPSTVVKVQRRHRSTGRVDPAQRGGDRRSYQMEMNRDWLLDVIEKQPDIALVEIQERLAEKDRRFSISSIWRFLRRHGLTLKKKTAHAAEQERPDVDKARKEWRDNQKNLDPAHLVFIDETAATTKMDRTHGWSPRGKRMVAAVPHGHWKTTTVVAALRQEEVTAPVVIDGPMTGPIFLNYVENVLSPTLSSGDIVVMDNVTVHKTEGVEKAINARGATLKFLPAYSPDLNPIEKAFAKLKAGLRKAAERTIPALWAAVGRIIDTISPQECRNCLQHCGYRAI